MISITGLDKAAVLAALYNRANPVGNGYLSHSPGGMDIETARMLLQHAMTFDYVAGRSLKIDLTGDSLEERLYDRDNGDGAASRAVETVVGPG